MRKLKVLLALALLAGGPPRAGACAFQDALTTYEGPQDRSGLGLPDNSRPGWPAIRASARAMCAACDIKTESLRNRFDEPAWTQITHAAEETCNACNVREVAGACRGCPGVEMLTRLIRGAHAKTPHVAEALPTDRLAPATSAHDAGAWVPPLASTAGRRI